MKLEVALSTTGDELTEYFLSPHGRSIHRALDRLYVMIFPDGTLTVPSGKRFLNYGPFLEIDDLSDLLARTDLDLSKQELHSKGWSGPVDGRES
jgi:hypothetical protein